MYVSLNLERRYSNTEKSTGISFLKYTHCKAFTLGFVVIPTCLIGNLFNNPKNVPHFK